MFNGGIQHADENINLQFDLYEYYGNHILI